MSDKKISGIRALRDKLTTKAVSCAELTQAYLDAIARDNGRLNAYVRVTEDTALETARRVDEKIARGEALAPLEGIPMTLKDNISTSGIPTTCCSRILEGYTPIYDATVWKLLKEQNAVLLGKTNMDEFAMGSSCETSCFGGAKNPHNPAHVAGGSSGGVASAVRPTAWDPTRAGPSGSRPASAALSVSSPPTARFPATASSPTPPASTKSAPSPHRWPTRLPCTTRSPFTILWIPPPGAG